MRRRKSEKTDLTGRADGVPQVANFQLLPANLKASSVESTLKPPPAFLTEVPTSLAPSPGLPSLSRAHFPLHKSSSIAMAPATIPVRPRSILASGLILLCATLLSACGGGGGGDGGGGVASFNTAEFRTSYGLGKINVLDTYNASYTGAGQTVAVIDSGIDLDHLDLDANISARSFDIFNNSFTTVNDVHGHGTKVAGVIAAEKNDLGMHGVAYEATILAIRADARCGCGFIDTDLATALDYAIAEGAGIINMSIGGNQALNAAFTDALLRATNAGAIITISAGNNGAANPEWPALYAKDTIYNGQIIAVGATDASNVIASFSERAGTARTKFLVAPGKDIFTTTIDGNFDTDDGTSFSAPYVAGAAALLKQRFPLLTAKQVVDLMLTTATDLGEAGVDVIYGQGLLNISAAFAPLGVMTVPLLDGKNPGIIASRYILGPAFGNALTTEVALTGIVGLDSWSRAFLLDLRGAVLASPSQSGILGGFVRGDQSEPLGIIAGNTDLSLRLTAPASRQGPAQPNQGEHPNRFQSISMTSDLGRLGLGLYYGEQPTVGNKAAATLPAGASRLAAPQLSLLGAGGGVSGTVPLSADFDLFMGLHRSGTGPGTQPGTLGQAWVSGPGLGGKGRFALGLGAVSEDASIFRTTSSGVFGNIHGGQSQFLTIAASLPISQRVQAFGAITHARAEPEISGGIMAGWRDIRASAFALGLSSRDLWADGDKLTLALGQPLRVDLARVDLTVPVSRDGADGFNVETRTVNAVPSGRELDLEISYGRDFGRGASLTTVLGIAKDPGHLADAKTSAFSGARLSMKF